MPLSPTGNRGKSIQISHVDAQTLGIVHGDGIVLDLPHAALELEARVSDRTAPGILVIPRRNGLFWQQFDSKGRLFINQTSIRVNKKE